MNHCLAASSLWSSSLGLYRKFQLNASSTFLLINKWINKSSPNLLLIFPGLNNFSSVFCYSWTSPVSKWLSDENYLLLFLNVITQALVSVIITFQLFHRQYFFYISLPPFKLIWNVTWIRAVTKISSCHVTTTSRHLGIKQLEMILLVIFFFYFLMNSK